MATFAPDFLLASFLLYKTNDKTNTLGIVPLGKNFQAIGLKDFHRS